MKYNFIFLYKKKINEKIYQFPFIFIIFFLESSAYSLTKYQINEICQKKSKRTTCIKNLKSKKSNLLQGNRIEIPILPFQKK